MISQTVRTLENDEKCVGEDTGLSKNSSCLSGLVVTGGSYLRKPYISDNFSNGGRPCKTVGKRGLEAVDLSMNSTNHPDERRRKKLTFRI